MADDSPVNKNRAAEFRRKRQYRASSTMFQQKNHISGKFGPTALQ
jgi:hypothetical protein